MNKVILLGRLTKDPEIRFSQSNNIKIAKFTLAVNRKYVKPGEEQHADFINIVTYSKLSDFTEKYLKQGLQICLSGRIQNRSWIDDSDKTHYITEIIAEEIDFADIPKKNNSSILWAKKDSNDTSTQFTDNFNNEEVFGSDDLPF